MTGERIDAARAKEIGLAGWVVPHESLMDEARALAARLMKGAPLAARAMEGDGDAFAAPHECRGDPVRRDDAQGGGRHRRRRRGPTRRRPSGAHRSGGAADRHVCNALEPASIRRTQVGGSSRWTTRACTSGPQLGSR